MNILIIVLSASLCCFLDLSDKLKAPSFYWLVGFFTAFISLSIGGSQ